MRRLLFVLVLAVAAPVRAQPPRQAEQDEYSRYELLAPETASFAIVYEVTATTPGATLFFNPIRKGSVASNEAVFDMMTAAPLKFEQVERRRGEAQRPGGSRRRHRLHSHSSRPRRAGRRRAGASSHRQDVQGCRQLFPRGQPDRVQARPRHPAERRRPAGGVSADGMQRAVAGVTARGWPRADQLHASGAGRGRARREGETGRTDRRRGEAAAAHERAQLGRARARRNRTRSALRARAPGSRHRLFPAGAVDARVQPVPRLHRSRAKAPTST